MDARLLSEKELREVCEATRVYYGLAKEDLVKLLAHIEAQRQSINVLSEMLDNSTANHQVIADKFAEAINHISAQDETIQRLREALRPYTLIAPKLSENAKDDYMVEWFIPAGAIRNAKRVYEETQG